MKKRWISVLGLCVLMLTACANEGAEEPAAEEEAAAPAEEGAATAPQPRRRPPPTAPTSTSPGPRPASSKAPRSPSSPSGSRPKARSFEATLASFEERTGIEITHDGVSDYTTVLSVRVEGGDPPDIAQIAQPGLMREFVADDALVDLSTFMNEEQLAEDYSQTWIDLASVDGSVYGVFFRAQGKSIVWYPVAAFEENGYAIPATWDELTALSQQIVDDGNGAPWCISQEQGDATGWVPPTGSRTCCCARRRRTSTTSGSRTRSRSTTPTSPTPLNTVGELWFAEGFAFGGPTYINTTWVGDTQTPMFAEGGPQCWMHKQAGWIADFWPVDANEEPLYTPGEDSAFFALPPIDEALGNPVLGGGDMMVMFDDRPEVRAVMEYLATPESAQGWAEAGGFIAANGSVPADWYVNYTEQTLAGIINDADTVRFDASDLMPAEVGQGTFWSGMVEWVAAEGANTDEVLSGIEESWPADAGAE